MHAVPKLTLKESHRERENLNSNCLLYIGHRPLYKWRERERERQRQTERQTYG